VPAAEIIVSDDCSTDDTAVVLQQLAQDIPTLRVLRKEKNVGIAQNVDACMRAATGDFVVRLDSDDFLGPTFIEQLSALLAKHPAAAYAHAAVQEIDQNGTFLRQRLLSRAPGFQASEEALQAAKKGYRVAANIIMFRRTALEAVNYSTGRPNYVEDFHLSASLAAAGFGNVYQSEILSFYRVWTDAGKTRQRRKLLEITGLYKVFDEVLEPAYKQRKWEVASLTRQRTSFACAQADCLGWNIYTPQEEAEITHALKNLSASGQTSFFIWIHSNGLGFIPNAYVKFMERLRLTVKQMLVKGKS
jgi:hypothetical protein